MLVIHTLLLLTQFKEMFPKQVIIKTDLIIFDQFQFIQSQSSVGLIHIAGGVNAVKIWWGIS